MKYISIDTETTGLFPYLGDRPFVVTMCNDEGKTLYLRAKRINPLTREVEWDESDIWEIRGILENHNIPKVFHHAAFDVRMLESIGVRTSGLVYDTMLMISICHSQSDTRLKPFCKARLGVPDDDEKELRSATVRARNEAKKKGWAIALDDGRHGDDAVASDYWLAPEKVLRRYAVSDVEDRTMPLFLVLLEEINSDSRLKAILAKEMRLWNATYRMVGRGIRCSREICRFEVARNRLKVKIYQKRILKHVGYNINLNSPKQVGKYIYEDLDIPPTRFTDSGQPSTDGKALMLIDHPAVQDIVRYKTAEKANSTFYEKYLMHTRFEAGIPIMHPDFRQIGASTGRFACRNPNLQNVANAFSTRSTEPIQARTPFGPRPGTVWYHFDWSQIEMWIFAAEANDKALLADLATGNIHTATANRVFGNGRDIVSEEKKSGHHNSRGRAKMLNFGVVFGMGVSAVAEFLKISRPEARKNLDLYYDSYPRIRPYTEELSDLARNAGHIWNRYGRKLEVAKDACYRSVNYIVQSSACDHMKNKMIWLDEECFRLRNRGVEAWLVLTIHDELVVELPIGWSGTESFLRRAKAELENHGGVWDSLAKLPVEIKKTVERWDRPEDVKLEEAR